MVVGRRPRDKIERPGCVHHFPVFTYYIIKIKTHSSCEIEDFVETHLCNLCVILRSRVLLYYVT